MLHAKTDDKLLNSEDVLYSSVVKLWQFVNWYLGIQVLTSCCCSFWFFFLFLLFVTLKIKRWQSWYSNENWRITWILIFYKTEIILFLPKIAKFNYCLIRYISIKIENWSFFKSRINFVSRTIYLNCLAFIDKFHFLKIWILYKNNLN